MNAGPPTLYYSPTQASQASASAPTVKIAEADLEIRLEFLKKVYSLLSITVLITFCTSLLSYSVPSIRRVFQTSVPLFWITLGVTVIAFALLYVFRHCYPWNLVALLSFALSEACLIGFVIASYQPGPVLLALTLTLTITVCLTLYTMQSARDFSSWGAGLFACLWVLLVGSLLRLFFDFGPLGSTIWSAIGALLFSLYIVYDTSVIMRYYCEDEWAFAVVSLYLDIMNLFMWLLALFGGNQQPASFTA